jgi:hypothetical protein
VRPHVTNFTTTLTVKTETDPLAVTRVSGQVSLTYTNTETDSSDTSQTATVTLSTATRDCTANYEVYYDMLFNTLAFREVSSATACQ